MVCMQVIICCTLEWLRNPSSFADDCERWYGAAAVSVLAINCNLTKTAYACTIITLTPHIFATVYDP